MTYEPPHPMQGIVFEEGEGATRFRRNWAVHHLFELVRENTNTDLVADLIKINLPTEDLEQPFQLLGYSLEEYAKLEFVRDETVSRMEIAEEASRPQGPWESGLDQRVRDQKVQDTLRALLQIVSVGKLVALLAQIFRERLHGTVVDSRDDERWGRIGTAAALELVGMALDRQGAK